MSYTGPSRVALCNWPGSSVPEMTNMSYTGPSRIFLCNWPGLSVPEMTNMRA